MGVTGTSAQEGVRLQRRKLFILLEVINFRKTKICQWRITYIMCILIGDVLHTNIYIFKNIFSKGENLLLYFPVW